ncbi:MAG: hypothetical protein KatS3mg121_1532 [Gammaproteobacteria bacterium]|nr:MAG: hypothetical protein KatS3mg121_1532 [Gammaproteobacteria bacterium]
MTRASPPSWNACVAPLEIEAGASRLTRCALYTAGGLAAAAALAGGWRWPIELGAALALLAGAVIEAHRRPPWRALAWHPARGWSLCTGDGRWTAPWRPLPGGPCWPWGLRLRFAGPAGERLDLWIPRDSVPPERYRRLVVLHRLDVSGPVTRL